MNREVRDREWSGESGIVRNRKVGQKPRWPVGLGLITVGKRGKGKS